MLIVKILLVIIVIIVLFVVFLRHKLEFFAKTPLQWKITFKNLLFKYSVGAEGGKFSSFIKLPRKGVSNIPEKEDEPEIIETRESIKPDEKSREDKVSPAKEKPSKKKREKIPEEDTSLESKSFEYYIEFAQNLWQREEKFVKKILKYVGFAIKLSLKIMTPAKIDISFCGGAGEPAETGWLYSVFVMFNEFFAENKKISLSFTPQFLNPEQHGQAYARYTFSIARFLLFMLLLVVKFPYISAFNCWRRNKKYLKKDRR